MPIPEETIRQIRESSDIVEIVSEYVSLSKKGSANYFGVCPFHDEKTPSFSVHTTRQTYHCFGCGEGGNVFNFLMKIEGLEFPDSVRRLAERTGIAIKDEKGRPQNNNEAIYQANELAAKFFRYHLTDQSGEDVDFTRKYLADRGISDEIAETFRIGLATTEWDSLLKVAGRRNFTPETLIKAGLARKSEGGKIYDWFRERLMFPILNPGGRVVAFGGRILKEDPDRPQPKYINTSETPVYHKGQLLYGLPQARDMIRQENTAILVEGYTDLIAMHGGGFTNTVAGLGTALTPDQAKLIKRFAGKIIVLYDSDTAGDMAAFRGADILVGANLEVRVALMPVGEDPDTLIRKKGSEAMKEVLDQAESLVDFKINHFKRKGKLDTPQSLSEATHALLETIREIDDPITRQFALHDVAEKLGISERTLISELAKIRKSSTGRSTTTVNGNSEPASYYAEMLSNLLWVLVQRPEHRSEIFSFVSSSDIGDHPLRPAFQMIENAHIMGDNIAEADLYNTLGNERPDVVRQLGIILNRPDPDNEKYVKTIVEDAPVALRRVALKKEITSILDRSKMGQVEGLVQRLQELKEELKNLDNKPKL
jgi:DNA primase